MSENPHLSLLPSVSPYSKGIFAWEMLSDKDQESLKIIETSLREKISFLRLFLEEVKQKPLLTYKDIGLIRDRIFWEDWSMSARVWWMSADNRLLDDFKTFCSHDYAQLRELPHGNRLYHECEDGVASANERFRQHKINEYTAVLACYENLLTILNGDTNTISQYSSSDVLRNFSEILERRFLTRKLEYLKKEGMLDENGVSVYAPFRLHLYLSDNLVLHWSAGAVLLMAMYNWAKNSITQGEFRGQAYSKVIKNPFYDAVGKMISERIVENGWIIDVHMEIFETEEAIIGCVSDTGAGFDLNKLKQALRELTKDEQRMSDFLRMWILSEETFAAMHEWEDDPRAFWKILSDLPSLIKMPRFSTFNDPKLQMFGMQHSWVWLWGIEVAAQAHLATTFITEQKNGWACMIMVIPKDPEKYRKTSETVSHASRTAVWDTLYRVPSHLKEKKKAA